MNLNITCAQGNNTTECLGTTPNSSAGLAVGLSLFFLVLGIAAALAVYTQRSKLRNMWSLGRGGSKNKEDHKQTTQDDSCQCTSMNTVQSTGHAPIYENFRVQPDHDRTVVDMDRLPNEPEEDLYLQCDSPDDAIYSNDPACSIALLPDFQEEDLYIVPDAL